MIYILATQKARKQPHRLEKKKEEEEDEEEK
jgi:hypothetical protein